MEKEAEGRRIEHVKRFGSFLYCPKRDIHCSVMEKNIREGTECERKPCLLDDPEVIEMKRRQEQNRKKREAEETQSRWEEQEKAPATRKSRTSTYEQRMWEKIHRLEEASQRAFRRNDPNRGHTLFNEARMMRYELREYMSRKK